MMLRPAAAGQVHVPRDSRRNRVLWVALVLDIPSHPGNPWWACRTMESVTFPMSLIRREWIVVALLPRLLSPILMIVASCTGTPDTWAGAGGTSFASPIMAGIQALVNQKTGDRQGNPNPVYYSLAAKEYGASGSSACNSTLGNKAASSCTFYDVTLGDNDVDCQNFDCYWPNASESTPVDPTVGSLTTDPTDNTFQDAYPATVGWDFATGIGSVNAANLVNNWPVSSPNFTLAASPYNLNLSRAIVLPAPSRSFRKGTSAAA